MYPAGNLRHIVTPESFKYPTKWVSRSCNGGGRGRGYRPEIPTEKMPILAGGVTHLLRVSVAVTHKFTTTNANIKRRLGSPKANLAIENFLDARYTNAVYLTSKTRCYTEQKSHFSSKPHRTPFFSFFANFFHFLRKHSTALPLRRQ